MTAALLGLASKGASAEERPTAEKAEAQASPRPAASAGAPRWTIGLGTMAALPERIGFAGIAYVTTASASYAFTSVTSAFTRIPVVSTQTEDGRVVFLANPQLGTNHQWTMSERLKLGLNLSSTVPVGHSAEDRDEPSRQVLRVVRGPTQFVNYVAFGPLGSIQYGLFDHVLVGARGGVTQFVRVRREDIDPDRAMTQLNAAATLGVSPDAKAVKAPVLFFSEARYNAWLTPTARAEADAAARDNLMLALGSRVRVPTQGGFVGGGLVYAAAVDRPLSDHGYHTLDLELSVGF
jgi:hypothetical protein